MIKIYQSDRFIFYFQWFSVTLCYYGLSFASTSLAGDAYSNYMLSVFIEIPGDGLGELLRKCSDDLAKRFHLKSNHKYVF